MRKIILSLVVTLSMLPPALAQDNERPAVSPSSVDCKLRIEKALREYDQYERQDAMIEIPAEDWRCMHQKMQEMHLHRNQMQMEHEETRHMMQPGSMPMHDHYNR